MSVRDIINQMIPIRFSNNSAKCRSLVRQLENACQTERMSVEQALDLDDSGEARYNWELTVADMSDSNHPGFAI